MDPERKGGFPAAPTQPARPDPQPQPSSFHRHESERLLSLATDGETPLSTRDVLLQRAAIHAQLATAAALADQGAR